MKQHDPDEYRYLRFDNNMLNDRIRVMLTVTMIALGAAVIFTSFFIPPDEPLHMPWEFTLIMTVAITAFLFFALSLQMKVFVYEDKILIMLFKKYVIQKSDIVRTEVVKSDALRDFGRWGVRRGEKKIGYIVPGQDAVKLTLKDGTEVAICDDNPERMNEIIVSMVRF